MIQQDDEFEVYMQRAYSFSSKLPRRSFHFSDFDLNLGDGEETLGQILPEKDNREKKDSRRDSGISGDSLYHASSLCLLASCGLKLDKFSQKSRDKGSSQLPGLLSPNPRMSRVRSLPGFRPRTSSTPSSRTRRSPSRPASLSPEPEKPTTAACRPQYLDLPGSFRPRTVSMPSRRNHPCTSPPTLELPQEGYIYRVRSFSVCGKSVVNQGDSFRVHQTNSSHVSLESLGSSLGVEETNLGSRTSSVGSNLQVTPSPTGLPPISKVLLLGAPGVGKTSLSKQFSTSEYIGHMDVSVEDVCGRLVPVLLDGEESMLHIVDHSDQLQVKEDAEDTKACVIVYSVTDVMSFAYAGRLLESLAHKEDRPPAVILVANKADLVRNRVISKEDGKNLAQEYGCKYAEVSPLLNLHIDELLVGILRQIRLQATRGRSYGSRSLVSRSPCLPASQTMHSAARDFIRKIMNNPPWMTKSCDNLLVL